MVQCIERFERIERAHKHGCERYKHERGWLGS